MRPNIPPVEMRVVISGQPGLRFSLMRVNAAIRLSPALRNTARIKFRYAVGMAFISNFKRIF